MNKAAFLFLIMIPSLSLCMEEEEEGLIELTNQSSTKSHTVHNQSNGFTKRSKKIATCALCSALLLFSIGLGTDAFTIDSNSSQVVITALSNATLEEQTSATCRARKCFCHSVPCFCCSIILFPDDNDAIKCENLVKSSEDKSVFIKRCKENIAKKTPTILGWVSVACRTATMFLALLLGAADISNRKL